MELTHEQRRNLRVSARDYALAHHAHMQVRQASSSLASGSRMAPVAGSLEGTLIAMKRYEDAMLDTVVAYVQELLYQTTAKTTP